MRKIVLSIFLLAFVCTVPLYAHELKVGILYHDIAQVWGNTKIEGGYDVNAEFIYVEGIVGGSMGISINSQGHTSRVVGGLVLSMGTGRVRYSLYLGGCAQVNSARKLGSPLLFRVAGEIGYSFGPHSISIILDHISNANMAKHNAGLDLFGVRYGWRW